MIARSRWFAAAALISLVTGCAGAQYDVTPLNPDPAPSAPRPASSVELFASTPPTRPHVDIMIVEVYNSDDATRTIADLRAEAGRRGCDALFVTPNLSGGRAKGTCLRYTTR